MEGSASPTAQSASRIVRRQQVIASEATVPVGQVCGAGRPSDNGFGHGPGHPTATPVVQDGIVQAVDLQCSCGCRVRLVLEYSAEPSAVPVAAAAPGPVASAPAARAGGDATEHPSRSSRAAG